MATPEDHILHLEYWVILIAQHFHISPMEVYAMPPHMVRRMLGWVLAISDERERMRQETKGKSSTTSKDVVSLDYSASFNAEGL